MIERKLRMGMIGGGRGAFIGSIHRFAAHADGLISLVCGALSSSKENALQSGLDLFLDKERIYVSYEEMIREEARLPEIERMDFVSIVTPNHLHFDAAMLALEFGFHVFIEKPITFNLEQAKALQKQLDQSGKILALAHTYVGYPMVKEAREWIRTGKIGTPRKVFVNYHQGWLSELSESEGIKQAEWRTDPARSGKCGAMGDIGVHAFNLAEYITGAKVTELCATLNTVVPGRMLDDDGAVLLKFEKNLTGILTATQVAAGEENNLSIKIYGDKGGLEWHQMEPNTLYYKPLHGPSQIFRAGSPYNSEITEFNTRTPGGHPEGYLEAFANLYRNFALKIAHTQGNQNTSVVDPEFPGIEEGIRGMAFIENVVASHQSNEKWTQFKV